MTISFRANKAGVAQTVPHETWTLISFSACSLDVDYHFNNSTGLWLPTPGVVTFNCRVPITNWLPSGQFKLRIIRNNDAMKVSSQVVGEADGSATNPANTASADMSVVDFCHPGDNFGLWIFASARTAASGTTINGDPTRTWFSGAML